jgi:membrane-associated phospholipid phosphatase
MSAIPRPVAVTTYAVLLVAWSVVIGLPNDPIGIALWIWLFSYCWRMDQPLRSHLQFVRDWAPWLGALAVYGLVRGMVDNVGFTPHVTAPIRMDEWLARLWGGDTVPTVSLQHRLCGDPCSPLGEVHWYDIAVSTVYASHFLTGLVIAGVLWIRNRRLWLEWIRRYVTISYLALVGYIVYPMAPPWMAGRDGLLPAIARISSRGFHELGIERTTMVFGGLSNQTAAMPSLHAGISFLVAFYGIARLRGAWRFLLLLYPVAMSAALIYAGEHYLIDTIMGGVIAALAMLGCAAWERRRGAESGSVVGRADHVGHR